MFRTKLIKFGVIFTSNILLRQFLVSSVNQKKVESFDLRKIATEYNLLPLAALSR